MTRILEALDFSRPVQPLFVQATRAGYVHSVFPGALNIAVDETPFTLLSDEKPRMPNSVRLPRCIMEQLYSMLSAGVQVRVGDGKLSIPILDLSIHLPGGEAWEPMPVVAAHHWRSTVASARVRILARHLAQCGQQDGLAPLVRPLFLNEATRETPLGRIALPLLRLLVQGSREQDLMKVEQAARGLAGLGPGLTPSGDDTLGGFIGVLALAGAPPGMDEAANKRLAAAIAGAARPRTTLLSATLLAHAARGELAEQVGELLIALTRPQDTDEAVLQAAERVLAYGACSGGDTLLGLLLGLQAAGSDYSPMTLETIMVIQALLKRNTYYDSITLMSVIQFVKEQAAVDDAGAVMATGANLALMEEAGLLPVDFLAQLEKQPGPEDLLIAIRAADEAAAQAALSIAEQRLAAPARKESAGTAAAPPARSLEMALRDDAEANLALVSVAGEHAWLEAEQALRRGLHVFLFSNNVSLEQELHLKKLAASKGLLLMGPDCGTAILNGIGLGFSNVVPRGNIGIVGASGTGMQQLTCLIAAAGMGISQAIGTGGRDLSEAIDGIMMRAGLKLLARDPQTEVIVLVSKLPAKRPAQALLAEAARCDKPVVAIFLGKAPEEFGPNASNIKLARTHTDGAELAVSFADGDSRRVPGNYVFPSFEQRLTEEHTRLAPSQRYVRALYSGGTLCYEAMLLLSEQVGEVASNIPLRPQWELAAQGPFRGHTALDLGTDEFTRGKPHPMIDPTTRLRYLERAAQDSETAVILLDIVLGFCSHPDPASVYAPAIQHLREEARAAGRSLPAIVSLCGTEGDPQRLSRQRAALEAAGALVFESNEAASFAAASLVIDTGEISPAKGGSHD